MAKLMDEIKKTTPFTSPEQEAFLNVQRTAEALADGIAAVLKSFNLSPTQYNVLRILRGADARCASAGLACREIGQRMVTRDPDITRLLDRLEKTGLIRRERSANDRRVVKTAITDDGLRLLAQLDAPVLQAHQRQLGHMSPEELRTLSQLLEKAREHPTAEESPADLDKK